MEDCEPLLAQSIVFHAVDYAAKLGFAPNQDFHEPLVGPRPVELLATPWASSERPLYIPGPDDNVARILHQLESAVGEDFQLGDVGEDPLDDASDEDAEELPVELNR
jgi:hypothetical protein